MITTSPAFSSSAGMLLIPDALPASINFPIALATSAAVGRSQSIVVYSAVDRGSTRPVPIQPAALADERAIAHSPASVLLFQPYHRPDSHRHWGWGVDMLGNRQIS